MTARPTTIFTIRHSTRSTEELIGLLRQHGVRLVADVRAHPGSRRHPHLGAAPLRAVPLAAGLAYHHMPRAL
jgi:uncharacterized protein (DUF488 family)